MVPLLVRRQHHRWLTLLVFAAAMFVAATAQAQTFPKLTGRVVDDAHLLSQAQVDQLTQLSQTTEQASSRQLVIATVPDLQGYPIEDYGYKLGRAWAVGQKDIDNGIILLVAPNEKKVRIEVGYGLEPIMTDALSNSIIQNDILPKFRAGDIRHCFADISAARRVLGYEPKYRLADGLTELASWLGEQTAVDQVQQAARELSHYGLTA